jgi:hypothetical protein
MSSENNKNYRRARTIALVLLFFLGISALISGIFMVTGPSGTGMGLPLELLDHTPFEDFLIPGILLALFMGILSLIIAILVLKNHRLQAWMIMFQGAVLAIWLSAEIIMHVFYALLTLPYYLVAILLLGCGLVIKLSRTGLS